MKKKRFIKFKNGNQINDSQLKTIRAKVCMPDECFFCKDRNCKSCPKKEQKILKIKKGK